MDTDALIASLAREAGPVRRLRPAWMRAALWLALALPPVVIVVTMDRTEGALSQFLGDRRTQIELAAILATALSAAICALNSTVPGSSRKWLLLPLLPLAVWLASLGQSCVTDWQRYGIASLLLRVDGPCFLPMVLMGVIPTVAILVMLRRGAPLMPRAAFFFAALAVAALANFGLRLVHVEDVSIMVLAWNFAVVGLIWLVADRRGAPILGWPRPTH